VTETGAQTLTKILLKRRLICAVSNGKEADQQMR